MTAPLLAAFAVVCAALLMGVSTGVARGRLRHLTGGGGSLLVGGAWRRPSPPMWTVVVVVAACGAGVAGALAGPVAAAAAALYGGLGATALLRRRMMRRHAALRDAALDAVAGLADDLRAGRPPTVSLSSAVTAVSAAVREESTREALRVAAGVAAAAEGTADALRGVDHPALGDVFRRVAAVWSLADAGIPLAGLLERLETEFRAQRRAAERAAAQVAAARATAQVLAGLPVLGLLLGHLLGADPVRVILETPLGGISAVAAMVLQILGLLWVQRLGSTQAVRW